MKKVYTIHQVNEIAKEIIKTAPYKVVLFYGDMGVGKTTLIKEICKELNVEDPSHSPTFSLVNEYQTVTNETIYHFDFYRIEDENEAYDIGIEDYLYSENWCFIEWPEHIKNVLPLNVTNITISLANDNNRLIELK